MASSRDIAELIEFDEVDGGGEGFGERLYVCVRENGGREVERERARRKRERGRCDIV